MFVFSLNRCHIYTQEGLSPCHLKKAKLMFFYTRYPSSNTLKTYFPDVKVSVSLLIHPSIVSSKTVSMNVKHGQTYLGDPQSFVLL